MATKMSDPIKPMVVGGGGLVWFEPNKCSLLLHTFKHQHYILGFLYKGCTDLDPNKMSNCSYYVLSIFRLNLNLIQAGFLKNLFSFYVYMRRTLLRV